MLSAVSRGKGAGQKLKIRTAAAPRPCRKASSITGTSKYHLKWHFPELESAYTRRTSVVSVNAGRSSEITATQKIFEDVESRGQTGPQVGGAGGRTTYEGLQSLDKVWEAIRTQPTGSSAGSPPKFVQEVAFPLANSPEVDVVICGGTLGIFLATSLQLRGFKVALVERNSLGGRSQDWNISWKELREVIELGVISEAEAKAAVSIEFNPIRAVFHGAEDKAVWTRDVLNLGVSPAKLVSSARQRFEAEGGIVLERCGVDGIEVHPNGARLKLSSDDRKELTARLVLDCMGHSSPAARQLRWGTKPDGICLVVGCCARGPWPDNTYADIIATATPLQPADAPVTNLQYFWEAFPAGSHPQDRTTYMFTYIDAEPHRPTLQDLFEDYWRLMPQYQGVKLADLEVGPPPVSTVPPQQSPLPPMASDPLSPT
mmetsp:Transcript_24284/g.57884  ORF Transcript_24284/g.57884 Transcript_24284/m.57884 type:complete len:429 (-) Transcript_24284:330-1616(-)